MATPRTTRPRLRPARLGVVAVLVVALLSPVRPVARVAPVGAVSAAPDRLADPPPGSPAERVNGRQVLAVSLDGFNVQALARLGRARTPVLHRLLRQGAATRNARTQVELTVTLPNHTSMVTGRRIDADAGGHGVDWNGHRPDATVQRAAGRPTASVFSVVHDATGRTALFATEEKLTLLERSWTHDIDRVVVRQDDDRAVVRAARRDLLRRDRSFTFVHLGLLDETGHEHGWLSRPYLRAVTRMDRLLGSLLRGAGSDRRLADLVVVLTADHGGAAGEHHHDDPLRRANHRVPFVLWGRGVRRGDLYRMNPAYADPGRGRPGFGGTQPVRNGDLANVATDLLGLGPVPGSRWNKHQRLRWR
ncbi:alkaline phosphatase family protein [Nocardioides sp. TF02-7]|uniref:alkaline phosphatase family protein n=1 Tax=Nocardioides sp. TF02-7 TaxID=2917724 RepID=UPI001F051BCD|nr:alkaline phosphatase family protein [Nocardioides sp. TF02-7]UMG91651.1 alkaline phosphatase family protein [Nocardioides sp. TF02-7]